MKHFKLKYGNGEVEFDLPTQEVVDVVEGADYPAIEDIPAALLEALDNPIGTAPLKDIVQHDETVCIVVSDITRAWIRYDAYLPTLLNYLNEAGVPDEKNFSLLIAYGAHRLQSEAESRSELVTKSLIAFVLNTVAVSIRTVISVISAKHLMVYRLK